MILWKHELFPGASCCFCTVGSISFNTCYQHKWLPEHGRHNNLLPRHTCSDIYPIPELHSHVCVGPLPYFISMPSTLAWGVTLAVWTIHRLYFLWFPQVGLVWLFYCSYQILTDMSVEPIFAIVCVFVLLYIERILQTSSRILTFQR